MTAADSFIGEGLTASPYAELKAENDCLRESNQRMRDALRRIAIYDDADCCLDSDTKTAIAREALR